MSSRKSWMEVSEGRLRRNYAELVRVAGGRTPVLAVVKANAYGHGAEICAPVLAAAGAAWLGVTDAEEGVRVREALRRASGGGEAGAPRILVMCGSLPEDAETIVAHGLTAVVWLGAQMRWLARARTGDAPVRVHVEIDTGMSRQGVRPGEPLRLLLDELRCWPELRVEGVLTHFASAEVSGCALTAVQERRFEEALEQMATRGTKPEWIHAGNSSLIDEAGELPWLERFAGQYGARPMVRSGLALYGYSLPIVGGSSTLKAKLRPVLCWKSRVIGVSELPAGATVGYNAMFTAAHAMRVALLPVGYADGLRRDMSGTDRRPGGWVMVRGQRAPIVGRVSMNLTTVDVSAIDGVAEGDEVVVLGDEITAEDHARVADTIAYEILCGLRCPTRLSG